MWPAYLAVREFTADFRSLRASCSCPTRTDEVLNKTQKMAIFKKSYELE